MSGSDNTKTTFEPGDIWPASVHYTTTPTVGGKPFPPGSGPFELSAEIRDAARSRRAQPNALQPTVRGF